MEFISYQDNHSMDNIRLNQIYDKGVYAIHYAVCTGDLYMVKFIHSFLKCNLMKSTSSGLTPIWYAVKINNIQIAEYLLENKCTLKITASGWFRQSIESRNIRIFANMYNGMDCLKAIYDIIIKRNNLEQNLSLPSNDF